MNQQEEMNMKKLSVFAAVSALALTLAGCGSSAAPAASEANPVVGDWELTKVTATVPGEEPAEMNPEENASLFGDKGYYTFNEDGTGSLNIYEGDTVASTDGTWTNDGDTYTFTGASGDELVVTYDKSADTLTREYTDDSADAQYSAITFVYTRKK
jgi:hypothetical protein